MEPLVVELILTRFVGSGEHRQSLGPRWIASFSVGLRMMRVDIVGLYTRRKKA